MSERIKNIIQEVNTDTSGKWISVDNAEILAEKTIRHCIQLVNDMDDHFAARQLLEYFDLDPFP